MIEISAIEPAADIQSSVQDIKGVCERLGRIFVPTERVVYFLANQERTRKHRKILYIKVVVFLSILCIVMLLFLLFKKGKSTRLHTLKIHSICRLQMVRCWN